MNNLVPLYGFAWPHLLIVIAGFLLIDVLLGARHLVLTLLSLWMSYRTWRHRPVASRQQ